MEPVMKHGRSTWDRAQLPPDEFEERRLVVERAAEAMGAVAVVGFADSSHPGLVGYLSNYLTAGALATLICVPGVEPTLLAGLGGGRDHPFIKGMSLVQDVRWFPQLGAGIALVLEEHGVIGGRIAVAGFDECFNRARADGVLAALAGYEVVTFDDALDGLRRNKREREMSAMRAGRAILGEAASAFLASLQATGDVHGALVVAERVAKLRGCRDFRALSQLYVVEQRSLHGLHRRGVPRLLVGPRCERARSGRDDGVVRPSARGGPGRPASRIVGGVTAGRAP